MNSNRFKFFASLFLFAATSLFISSCGSDDATPSKNHFTLGESKTTVKAVVFESDPTSSVSPVDGEPYYRHYIDLLGSGFTVNGTAISGDGNLVTLGISGATVGLDAGTYEFTGTEENPKAYELWDGQVELITSEEFIFEEATLEISKSGSTYTIDFTATVYPPDEVSPWLPDLDADPQYLTGHFSGSIITIVQD